MRGAGTDRAGRGLCLAGAWVVAAILATLGAASGTGCGGGTRVVVEVLGQEITGLTGLDVTFTNETESGSIRIPEVGEKEGLTLPVSFGLRLHDGIEGSIEVCVSARGATVASGCSGSVPLVVGGRTELTVTLEACVGPPCEWCGDGVINGGEQCDGGDFGGADCVTIDQGFTGGDLGCAFDCSYDVSGCTVLAGCGDGVCSAGEDEATCSADCPPVCGDGFCSTAETCFDCFSDCCPSCGDFDCDWLLGGETCSNCPSDCGCGTSSCSAGLACAGGCGSDVACLDACHANACAEAQEQLQPLLACAMAMCSGFCVSGIGDPMCVSCVMMLCGGEYSACGTTCGGAAVCGDGLCDPGEDCTSCPGDCGACGAVCGNGICEMGEDCTSCPGDCGGCTPTCGDGVCDPGESNMSCPSDCA